MPRPADRLVVVLAVLAVVATACGGGDRGHGGDGAHPNATGEPNGFYLATSFERPVCGNYHHPGAGCEFGIQGPVETGDFGCRTGPSCLSIGRGGDTHQGAIRLVPVEGGHAFVGCAFRVPALPSAQKPFIELMQLSPGDGTEPLNPIELRISTADRTLSVGEFQGPEEPATTWRAPVDQWFYAVVEMNYGEAVPTRLWVYGTDDKQAATLEVALTTSGGRDKANPRQKVGGVTNTFGDVTTYADDWYIAKGQLGPLHIGADGAPIGG
jgi:hypothetical protein